MPTDEELQKLAGECKISTMRGSGPGGQHRNKVETAVRVVHNQTGISCTSQRFRSQHQNKIAALTRLWEKLRERSRPKKKRIATRPSRGSKARRLESKRRTSLKKESRRKPNMD